MFLLQREVFILNVVYLKVGVEVLKSFLTETKWNAMEKTVRKLSWK